MLNDSTKLFIKSTRSLTINRISNINSRALKKFACKKKDECDWFVLFLYQKPSGT